MIDYKLKLRGLSLKWRTEITEWNPPFSFTDEALKSPYKQWIHHHKKIDFLLVKNLIGKGYIKTDSLKLGIDALPCGRVIDRNEKISDVIYTIGTALKGKLWESTAMSEIRAQANKLAMALLD